MTAEEKKAHLLKYRLQQIRINRICEMIKTYPSDAIRYREQLDSARKLRNLIESEIEAVGDDTLCEVLSQRYLCGKTMDEIAESMNYSRRQIERLSVQAIARFEPF